jgi:hypothetical protein
VGKGWLKERCRLEPQTNFVLFKKSPKAERKLDSGADLIREYMVLPLLTTGVPGKLLRGKFKQHATAARDNHNEKTIFFHIFVLKYFSCSQKILGN